MPYTDDRELMMDVLKFGDDCIVIAPEALRQAVAGKLYDSISNYSCSELN